MKKKPRKFPAVSIDFDALARAYAQLKWQWLYGIPSATDLRDTYLDLLKHVDKGSGSCMTGGLIVFREKGKATLVLDKRIESVYLYELEHAAAKAEPR